MSARKKTRDAMELPEELAGGPLIFGEALAFVRDRENISQT